MSRINVLDSKTANAIKAGEVIERPSSVVKELVDNSIDAGASKITITFENGGISYLNVTDDGIGMDSEDAQKAFLIHATSKIQKIEDIYSLTTQGFRGEALPSVAACSDVTLITRQRDSEYGIKICYENGSFVGQDKTSADYGTSVTVTNIFKNIPARYKFLKKDATEGMYISNLIEKLAVVNPHIAFKLYNGSKLILQTPGNGSMKDAIYSVYGKDVANSLVEVNNEYEGLKLKGFTGKPDFVKSNRSMQIIYVNERNVKSSVFAAALDEAYRNLLMKGKFSVCFLCIYVPANQVDVNVHPQKSEVRFDNESNVFRLIHYGVKGAILNNNSSPEIFGSTLEKDTNIHAANLDMSTKSSIDNTMKTNLKEESYNSYINTFNGNGQGNSQDNNQCSNQGNGQNSIKKPMNQSQMRVDFGSVATQSDVNTCKDMLKTLSEIQDDVVISSPDNKVQNPNYQTENVVFIDDNKVRTDLEEIKEAQYIGSLFNTYIIMQNNDKIYLIDQHAAHERVLYEDFLRKYKSNKDYLNKQELLVPKVISLSKVDCVFVDDNKSLFDKMGFEIELIGDSEVAVRTVPFESSDIDVQAAIEEIISTAQSDMPENEEKWFSLIATKACKAAIKGNQKIDDSEVYELISLMQNLNDPYHCPHGRPTFIKMTKNDLEKEFKRIV